MHVKLSIVEPVGVNVIPPGSLAVVGLILIHIRLLQVVALLPVPDDALLKVHLVEAMVKVEEVLATTTPFSAVLQTLRFTLVEVVLVVAKRWTMHTFYLDDKRTTLAKKIN